MSRYADTLSSRGLTPSVAGERVNIHQQGPNGYLLDMALGSALSDYVRLPLTIKMLRAPRGFQYVPHGEYLTAAFKTLIETWMQTWTGFNKTLNVSAGQTQIGWSGENFHTPTRVSRSPTSLQSTVVEKYGRPVIRMLEDLVRFFIADPDVGHPLLSGITNQATDRLNDMFSFDLIAYEHDWTHQKAENAFLLTNVFPTGDIGENLGAREIQGEGSLVTYNLTWACWQKVGYAVDELAQKFIDAARVTGIDPGMVQNPVNDVDANVLNATRLGFSEQINTIKRQLVTPR